MPSTWSVLAFFTIRYDDFNIAVLVLIGAIAATIGRLVLAKLTRILIRDRLLDTVTRKNVDTLRDYLEKEKRLLFLVMFAFALTPLPSNQVFMAYGLTSLPLRHAAAPFFLGRLISYFAIVQVTDSVVNRFIVNVKTPTFVWYFLTMQIITIVVVFLFTKIDWRRVIPHGA